MCYLKVDLDGHCHAFGADSSVLDEEVAALRPLIGDGLVETYGKEIRVTERGRPLVRVVASVFDRFLENSAGQHAQAV